MMVGSIIILAVLIGSVSAATFTTNQTANNTPLRAIQFTDTGTYGWHWYSKDYHNATVIEYQFSTSHNPIHTFGIGNFSIKLNADGVNSTSTWINVSAGRSDNQSLPGTYRLYPANSVWNTPITDLDVHANSQTWVNRLIAINPTTNRLKLSYTNTYTYFVVNSTIDTQRLITTQPYYRDNVEIPIPDDYYWEQMGTDRPLHLYDPDRKILWELANLGKQANGTITGAVCVWNTSNNLYRFYPNTWLGNNWYGLSGSPSALRTNVTNMYGSDVGGVPMMQETIRYEEVAAGFINHSVRLGVINTSNTRLWPANAVNGVAGNVPMGSRWRLKASKDISGLGTQAQVIAQALKTYGGIVSINGGYGLTLGAYNDSRWTQSDIDTLQTLHIEDFEVVDESSLMIDSMYSMQATTVTEEETPPEPPEINATYQVIYPDLDFIPYRRGVDETWAEIIAGEGTGNSTLNSTIFVRDSTTTNKFQSNDRYIAIYNMSNLTIPEGKEITDIRLRFYGDEKYAVDIEDLGAVITDATPPNMTYLSNSDYNRTGNILLSNIIKYANFTTQGDNNFTITNLSYFPTTGRIAIALKGTWDSNQSVANVSWYSGQLIGSMYTVPTAFAGTDYDPYMEVTYQYTAGSSASFTKSKTVVRIPGLIYFNDTSNLPATTWNWSFGDGTYGATKNVSHVYKTPGRKTVILSINGGEAEATDVVTVTRRGGDYQLTLPKENEYSCEAFTYSTSRALSVDERARTEEKIAGVCEVLR